jgi:hypothetical protein
VCVNAPLPLTGPSADVACGQGPSETAATVADAGTLTLGAIDFIPGELELAAIVTAGAPVTPPQGWTAVPGSDQVTSSGERLEVFYDIPIPLTNPNKPAPTAYSFRSSTRQRMTGLLSDYTGASQTVPIDVSSGGVSAVSATEVTAPSVTPSAPNTALVFIGAAASSQRWRAPAGMTLIPMAGSNVATSRLVAAYQRWHGTTATGPRTSPLSTPGEGLGDLIAIAYPSPVACPDVKILNRRERAVPVLHAARDGRISVRLKCIWTVRCVGDFGAFGGPIARELASARFVVPAGATRTVQVYTCAGGTFCSSGYARSVLRRGGVVPVTVYIVAVQANGQVVPAGGGSAALVLP